MTFIIIGVVLIAISLGLLFASKGQAQIAAILKMSKAHKVADILGLQSQIAQEIGPGAFRELVEVRGKPIVSSPLQGELSGKPCLYYRMTVTREYEETDTSTDSQGNRTTSTRRGNEIVSSNTRFVNFKIDDGSGAIEIRPEGCEVELVKAVDTFQQGEGTGSISFGKFHLDFGKTPSTGRRTIGYRYEEHILPLDQPIFVFGEASDNDNILKIGRPEKKGLFLISTRIKEEIVRSREGSSKGLKIGAIVTAVLGVAGVVLGIIFPS